jgi:hypothetical protein
MSIPNYVKRCHALLYIPSYGMPPHTLHIFGHLPTKGEVDSILRGLLPLPTKPVPFMYSEKPQINVVPMDISMEHLVKNSANPPK